jgi:transcriptional regulator with XRE-family HTH domain
MCGVKSKLGNKLRTLRGERTLYQVANAIGINRRQLQRYEEGRLPEDEPLEKIADYYQVQFADLKELYFEDLYPEGERNREVLKKWIQKLLTHS